MHFSALLLILVAAAVTGEVARGAHPAASTPAARFWEEALPGSPLPEAIADLIQKGIEQSPLKEKGIYSAVYDVVGRGQYYHEWSVNFTRGTPPRGFFFHEEDMVAGGAAGDSGSVVVPSLSLSLPPATTAAILPRAVAERVPFGRLEDALAVVGGAMTPGSAEIVEEDTLRGCREPPRIPGERRACATSLEAAVRAATRMLLAAGAGEGRMWAVASAVPRAGLPRQQYAVTAVRRLPGDHHVGCHVKTYPYAVFHCHMLAQPTRAYVITIRALGSGSGPAEEVDMAALCHLDTSDWNPGHPAFEMLGTRPGGKPICHFLPYANLLFGKVAVEDADA